MPQVKIPDALTTCLIELSPRITEFADKAISLVEAWFGAVER